MEYIPNSVGLYVALTRTKKIFILVVPHNKINYLRYKLENAGLTELNFENEILRD
ncbi:Uncharacterised protein [Legionella sainthelensi]|nr:Uncharacterised protein [Legionella sainthelensi]